jgi:hypothetical protein
VAPPRRTQIADRGRPAPPVFRRQLEIAGAFLRRTVEVVIARNAGALRRFDEGLAQRVRLADVGHRERSADTMEIIGAARLVLGAPKIRQHVGKTPAGIAELAPMIVVLVLAADIEQAVDRARSAQHLAARLDDLAIVELGFRFGLVQPIDLGIIEQLTVAERNMNPDVPVVAAGLEQKHAMAAGFGEAIGEHAAGRTGADDDVVEPCFVRNRRHGGLSLHSHRRDW